MVRLGVIARQADILVHVESDNMLESVGFSRSIDEGKDVEAYESFPSLWSLMRTL